MITIHNYDARYSERMSISREEQLIDERLALTVADAEGKIESHDLMPMLTERLAQPDNGVLNALRRGVEANRLAYTVGPRLDPNDIATHVVSVRSLDRADYDA